MPRSRVLVSACFALLGAIAATQASADWRGRGEIGAVLTRGNASTDSVNVKFDLVQELERWTNEVGVAALRARAEEAVTAQRHETRLQTNYQLGGRTGRGAWFLGLRYSDDRFSGFDYQASASTGYRHRFVDTPNAKFNVQFGAGYRRLQNSLTLETDTDLIGRGDVNFEFGLTDTTRLINRLTAEVGSTNALVDNQLSLEVKMSDAFALAVGALVRYNSEPPVELRKTDTVMTANVVYAFQ